jgi:hypothetical protein
VGSQPPQLGQEGTATSAAVHKTCGSIGAPMGGTSRVPFRKPTGGTVQQGDKIPLGSFHTADATARAHDGWAAATPKRALGDTVSSKRGSARAPRQRAAPTTRPGAHAHGLLQRQRNDGDDDAPEQLADSDGSDGDDDGGGGTSLESAGRGTAQWNAPAAAILRGSKADCTRYVGVCFV